MSHVTCHVSRVTCHMSRVTFIFIFFSFFFIFFLPSPPPKKKYWSYDPHRSRDSLSPVCGIFFYPTPPKKYWSYYPHRSRDSVSPVCRIFLVLLIVSVLLSAFVERVSVSRMRDFLGRLYCKSFEFCEFCEFYELHKTCTTPRTGRSLMDKVLTSLNYV